MLKYLIKNKNTYKKEDIAAFGQKYMVKGVIEMALRVAEDTGIDTFALSGGVFVNEFITHFVSNKILKEGYKVIRNLKVPPGDGGSALGQAIIALNHVI